MTQGLFEPEAGVVGLRRALPYIRLFKGATFVVKIGGVPCADPDVMRDLAEQVGVLAAVGINVVLVHGGGPQATELAERMGVRTPMVCGRRVTDTAGLEVVTMAFNGTINTAILSAFRAVEVPAAGLSGIDGALVVARKRPPRMMDVDGRQTEVDFGWVGDIVDVNVEILVRLLDSGFVPVVSPLCSDDAGQVLNINADTVASAIARALGAEKLIFLTDIPGLLENAADPRSLVSYVDLRGVDEMAERGAINGGMLPKVAAAREALGGGVARVHMVGYRVRSGLLREVFTNEGAGTLMVRDAAELLPGELAQ
jgi:acetylglutamate kinase